MTTKQNPFEDLFKLWVEQTQKFMHDPTVMKGMMEQFSKLQTQVRNLYDTQYSQSSSSDVSHDLYDAIIRLTNRINELEARIGRLEPTSQKPSKRDRTKS